VAVVTEESKVLSSTEAMERTRNSSPYYRSWLTDSQNVLERATEALACRNLEGLGAATVLSYSRMHAAMMASEPPVVYWRPATVAIIEECRRMREDEIGAWETIDAGPQVKILCLERDVEEIARRIGAVCSEVKIIVSSPGGAPQCTVGGAVDR
jgi:diphosphomevalonate decarboxylase